MKKYMKDIGMMSMGGMMAGAGALAIGKMGGDSSGISAASSMMPAVGSIVGMGAMVRQVGGMTKSFSPKRQRKHRRRR